MNAPANSAQHRSEGRRSIVTTFMLGVWLVVNVIVVSPYFHHLLHQDSANASHDCFITQLAMGQLASDLPGVVAVIVPPISTHSFPAARFRGEFNSFYRLPHCCGPPSAFPQRPPVRMG